MTVEFDDSCDQAPDERDRQYHLMAECSSTHGLPELVSAAYEQAPTPVRTKFIEHLLRPVGPLALVAIANGAFGHLLYRLAEAGLVWNSNVENLSKGLCAVFNSRGSSCDLKSVLCRSEPWLAHGGWIESVTAKFAS